MALEQAYICLIFYLQHCGDFQFQFGIVVCVCEVCHQPTSAHEHYFKCLRDKPYHQCIIMTAKELEKETQAILGSIFFSLTAITFSS